MHCGRREGVTFACVLFNIEIPREILSTNVKQVTVQSFSMFDTVW